MEIYGIFDSHAHYFDRRFASEYPGGADALLRELLPHPVSLIINVGTNPENSRAAIAQAAEHPGMFAAAGIHPEDCHTLTDPEAALADLRGLLGDAESRRRDKIVALGEIGLDYHYETYGEIALDRAKEMAFFEAQLELAEALDLPVIIHDRDAHADTMAIVREFPGLRGVFHCFAGSVEMARELVDMGWYLSFNGAATFKNARKAPEVIQAVPMDRLMIETDAPYLTPVPYRGRRNDSTYVHLVAESIAQLRDMTPAAVEQATWENGKRFFGI